MVLSRTLVTAAVTLLCFTQSLEAAAAKRTTTASPSTDNQLQEALASAQQAITGAANEVSQALGINNLPAPETVASQLHNQTLGFARILGQFVGQLHNEATSHQGALSGVLQSAADRLNETATNLQTGEVTRNAQELQTSLSSSLQTFFEEAQKVVNAIVPDSQAAGQNLQQFARTAIERAQETATEFKTSLQTATQSQPAH